MKSSKGKLTKFGKLVVKALTDQDMTKTQLAAEIGTSPQYLSYILYGVRSGEKYLPLIVATLNLDPNKVEKAIAA
ncbi:Helix-turn-helix [butyrate-producing bacterium SS3/4]|jgi:cyanate lyase|nr:Helix-turn-helix [butyrate-producing bacterium SS3/4]